MTRGDGNETGMRFLNHTWFTMSNHGMLSYGWEQNCLHTYRWDRRKIQIILIWDMNWN